MPNDRGCGVEGCGKSHEAKGWCKTHYYHYNKGRDPHTYEIKERPPLPLLCTFEGCGKKHRAAQLCQYHYDQKRRGLPLTTWTPLSPRISNDILTQDILKENIAYDPETGNMTWKRRGIGRKTFGEKNAGTLHPIGYRQIKIGPKFYYAHRLAFLYMTGAMPEFVDHINGDKGDNRWDNLREVNRNQNLWNSRRITKRKYHGVFEIQKGWKSIITNAGTRYDLGTFPTPEEASEAYESKAKELRGEFYCPTQREVPKENQCTLPQCTKRQYAMKMCRSHYEPNRGRR